MSSGFGVSGGWAAIAAQPPLTPKRGLRSAAGAEATELESPDKIHGRLVGVTDYLMKPFDTAELVKTAQKYLRTGPEAMT